MQKIKVKPAMDEDKKPITVLDRLGRKIKFQEGGVEIVEDSFIRRRIKDGSLIVIDGKKKSKDAPNAGNKDAPNTSNKKEK